MSLPTSVYVAGINLVHIFYLSIEGECIAIYIGSLVASTSAASLIDLLFRRKKQKKPWAIFNLHIGRAQLYRQHSVCTRWNLFPLITKHPGATHLLGPRSYFFFLSLRIANENTHTHVNLGYLASDLGTRTNIEALPRLNS